MIRHVSNMLLTLLILVLPACKAVKEAAEAGSKLVHPPKGDPPADPGRAAAWLAWPFAWVGALLCLTGGVGMMIGFGTKALVAGLAIGGTTIGLFLFMDSASPVIPWLAGGAGVVALAWATWMLATWTMGLRTSARAAGLRLRAGNGTTSAADARIMRAEARALDHVGPRFRTRAKFKHMR